MTGVSTEAPTPAHQRHLRRDPLSLPQIPRRDPLHCCDSALAPATFTVTPNVFVCGIVRFRFPQFKGLNLFEMARLRLGYTKSRTGCLRCKARRVKVGPPFHLLALSLSPLWSIPSHPPTTNACPSATRLGHPAKLVYAMESSAASHLRAQPTSTSRAQAPKEPHPHPKPRPRIHRHQSGEAG